MNVIVRFFGATIKPHQQAPQRWTRYYIQKLEPKIRRSPVKLHSSLSIIFFHFWLLLNVYYPCRSFCNNHWENYVTTDLQQEKVDFIESLIYDGIPFHLIIINNFPLHFLVIPKQNCTFIQFMLATSRASQSIM